jgi:hypothetical protein
MMVRKDFVVNEPTRRCTAWIICECVMTRRFLIFNFEKRLYSNMEF